VKPALTFIFSVLLLFAQNDVRPATIEGVAKNQKTGEPLADVRVTLTQEFPTVVGAAPAAKSATTDTDGKFVITGIAPGRYNVAAARTLFFRPRRNTGALTVSLTADQKLSNLQILMMQTGVIAGRIVDENREPVRSVRVEALRSEYRDGVRNWVVANQNTTDDRGEYRVFNLQPGTYYVRATQSNIGAANAPVYYPGVPDSQDASPVQVDAGGELGAIDIALRRTSEYSVKFKVGGVPAGAVLNFTVQKRSTKIVENVASRPDLQPDGSYLISRLPPGAYEVFVQIATPPQVQPRVVTHAGKFPVNIGRSDEDLGTVAIRATVPVSGKIVATETLPSTFDVKRLTLTFRPLDMPATAGMSIRGNSNPPGFNDDGSFTVPNLAAARYQITLTGLPNDTYLVGARSSGRDVFDSGYVVSGDQSPLEVLVGGPGSVGVVEGAVVNVRGEPMPGSTVVLVPPADRRVNPSAFRTTTTDQQGNFSIRSVLLGDYKVMAWEDVEPGAFMDPEFLKDYETRGETLRVQKGTQNTVAVRIIPAS
jgi:hypothetical protein